MTTLNEGTAEWIEELRQVDTTDPVLGGPNSINAAGVATRVTAVLFVVGVLSACVPAHERTCSAVDTQATAGLLVGSGAVMIGAAVAVDPTQVRDDHDARVRRTTAELALAGLALGGFMTLDAARGDTHECIPAAEAAKGTNR